MTIYRNRSYLEKSRYGEPFDLPAPQEGLDFVFVVPFTSHDFVLESLKPFHEEIDGIKAEFLLAKCYRQKEGETDHLKSTSRINEFLRESRFPYPLHLLKSFDIPKKKSLTNLAYKIGMDEALSRFQQVENKNGWIISVDPGLRFPVNALLELKKAIYQKPRKDALGFGFSLPKSSLDVELGHRYLIEALRFSGHPHAFYTFGNTFAYRQTAYEKNGGIPQKKIGYSFSFIQKFIAEGRFRELSSIKIERTDIGQMPQSLQKDSHPNFKLFLEIKDFLTQLEAIFEGKPYKVLEVMEAFLVEEGFEDKLREMQKHSNSIETFSKRFFAWFGLVKVSKFLEFGEQYYPAKGRLEACRDLFDAIGVAKQVLDEAGYLDESRKLCAN